MTDRPTTTTRTTVPTGIPKVNARATSQTSTLLPSFLQLQAQSRAAKNTLCTAVLVDIVLNSHTKLRRRVNNQPCTYSPPNNVVIFRRRRLATTKNAKRAANHSSFLSPTASQPARLCTLCTSPVCILYRPPFETFMECKESSQRKILCWAPSDNGPIDGCIAAEVEEIHAFWKALNFPHESANNKLEFLAEKNNFPCPAQT